MASSLGQRKSSTAHATAAHTHTSCTTPIRANLPSRARRLSISLSKPRASARRRCKTPTASPIGKKSTKSTSIAPRTSPLPLTRATPHLAPITTPRSLAPNVTAPSAASSSPPSPNNSNPNNNLQVLPPRTKSRMYQPIAQALADYRIVVPQPILERGRLAYHPPLSLSIASLGSVLGVNLPSLSPSIASVLNSDISQTKKFCPFRRILSYLSSYSRLLTQVLLSALTRRAIISRQPAHIRQVGVLSSVESTAVRLLFLCLFHRHLMPTSVVRPKFFLISVGCHPTSFFILSAGNPSVISSP